MAAVKTTQCAVSVLSVFVQEQPGKFLYPTMDSRKKGMLQLTSLKQHIKVQFLSLPYSTTSFTELGYVYSHFMEQSMYFQTSENNLSPL